MAHHSDNSAKNVSVHDHASLQVGNVYHVAAPQDLTSRKAAVLKSLFTSPYEDRKDRNPVRVPGTCEWFRAHHLYRQWREAPGSSFLWVSADPGCGKSVLARFLVDEELRSTETCTTCYFFFKDDFEDQRSVTSALKCIIHQLLQQKTILLSEEIVEYFDSRGDILLGSITQLWRLLLKLSRAAGEVVCVLDAFDECNEKDREEFTRVLGQFFKEAPPDVRLKVLLTSRAYGHIRQGFEEIQEFPSLPILHLAGENEGEVAKIADEIRLVIEFETIKIGKALRLRQDEEALLRSQLLRNQNRTYLWVYLTMDLIRKDLYAGKGKIQTLTSELSQSIDEVYDKILSRSIDPLKANRVLQMVLAASRPLTLEEMVVALAVRKHHQRFADMEADLSQLDKFRDYLRDLCGLFITVIDSRIFLLHQTAKEFLMARGTVSDQEDSTTALKWKHSITERQSNATLAHACVWYLLLDECLTKNRRFGLHQEDAALKVYVFFQYSATHWPSHYRRSNLNKSDGVIRLFNEFSTLIRHEVPEWFEVHWEATSQEPKPDSVTPLMAASHCGILAAAKDLLKDDSGLQVAWDAKDLVYPRSPLSLAAEQGHHEIISLFLDHWWCKFLKWTNFVDAENADGKTALAYAAMKGHWKAVDLLLSAGARIDHEDEYQGTPLIYGVCSGDQSTMELLLSKNRPRKHSEGPEETIEMQLITMASRAIIDGVGRVLRIVLHSGLISADACISQDATLQSRLRLELPTSRDLAALSDERELVPETLLHLAAARGNAASAQVLLDYGADVDRFDQRRAVTALHWGVRSHDLPLCKLLLDHEANPQLLPASGKYAVQMRTTWGIWALLVERNGLPPSLEYREATRLALLGSAGDLSLLLSRDSCVPTSSVLRRLLVTAVIGGNSDTLSLLLKLDRTTGPSLDRTKLLELALDDGRALSRHTIPVLLEAGGDLKATSDYDRLLWTFTVYRPSFRLVRILLAHGLSPNSNKNLRVFGGKTVTVTVLEELARKGQRKMAQLLIDAGANDAVLTDVTWGSPIYEEDGDDEWNPLDDNYKILDQETLGWLSI